MIVNLIFGHILLLILPVGISILLLRLCIHKWHWNERFLILALLPGLLIYLFTWATCTIDLVLVKPDLEIERSLAFFSADYESPDGQKLRLQQKDRSDVFIVNASEATMAIESISYGKSYRFFNFGPEIIPPHRTIMERNVPDYFPDEQPPHSVSVSKGVSSDSRDWLRRAGEDEAAEAQESTDLVPLN